MNDTHGSFSRSSADGEAGMAYISSYIKEKVAQNPNDLVLSGGDMFQGGIESNQTRGKIMVEAMNEIGFDAMALGNHELDWGEDVLKETLKLADFPVISCNTFYSDRISIPEWITPFTVVQKQDITVGIIGFARYNMGSSVLASVANQFYFPKASEYIKKYSRELRLSYNCDLVLGVGHDEGANSSDYYLQDIESVTYTDSTTGKPYVDGLMFAHDHATQSGRMNGVPYMEASCNGKKLGVLNYKLEYNGVLYEPKSNWVTILDAYNTCKVEDPAVSALLTKYADEIGDTNAVLYTFTRAYSRDELVRIVCQAMAWFVNNNQEKFGNETVYIASHNYGGVRVDRVGAGAFTMRDLIEMMPFENILAIQKCTKKQVETLQTDTYYRTYTAYEPVYVNNVTTCVTISYVAESGSALQQSYKEYPPYTARDALVEFMKSGEPIRI